MAANHINVWHVVTLLATAMHLVEAAAFQLTKSSIRPPFGNSLFLKVNATGFQIYKCDNSSNGSGMREYNHIGANAKLYSPYGNGKDKSVGYHYYLSHLLAQGGQPTFSFSIVEGDPVSVIPESTVTVNSIGTEKANNEHDIDDLLLKAVSHSGYGRASDVSYIQRRHSKGGAPPPSCGEDAKEIHVAYTAQYLFWSQERSLSSPASIATEISTASDNMSPLFGFYSEGYQHYIFNGSSWINFNATSFLYTSPGQEVVGSHYFLTEADENGGQLSWELFMPLALSKVRVTAKVLSTVTVEEDSIDWSKLEATSYGGSPHDISRSYMGQVKYVQRVSTVGGLPPKDRDTANPNALGDIYLSPFSTIYWFYSNLN